MPPSDRPPAKAAPADAPSNPNGIGNVNGPEVRVRRIHRRDLNRVWEFIKLTFRDVNRQTVEYQRPRTKNRFVEVYEEEGVEQLIFEMTLTGGGGGTTGSEVRDEIVGYTECTFEVIGEDNWINERYFEKRDMRPLYVEELAVHPEFQGYGIGSFVMEQLEHLARVRGCTHLVLEVAENNENALRFYRARNFYKLDSAIFLAKKVQTDAELLPPRQLRRKKKKPTAAEVKTAKAAAASKSAGKATGKPAAKTNGKSVRIAKTVKPKTSNAR